MIDLELLLYLIPILVVSLMFHELAHALVATRLGDPTAREQGRLTLNPIAHLDPLGTAMFVLTLLLTNFAFGWAKPVAVNPRNFRRPKEGMGLVAAAGPVTNFALALASVAAFFHLGFEGRVQDVLQYAFFINVVLGIFNLIPIPPLDGSRIAGAFMSNPTYARWVALDQYGMLVLFGLIFFFRDEFFTLFSSTLDVVGDFMVRLVGA